jgi:site-specific DNA-methyltransferase (adenine-specific)
MPPTRRPTSTSNFGAGRRESHDATAFYERFTAPTVSTDETVNPCSAAGRIIVGDSRDMSAVESSSVALVVTSPPYFAGKAYEEALGEGHIPASYLDYLTMLRDVFAECVRVLEPGGRIAVNVANLGRRPYRSLAGDITTILQDDLALLLRGEVVWVKADGASGSTAWGSFQSAANPVLRDLSERIIVASKGRFDRAPTRAKREKAGLPFENTISKQEFMDSTLDIWRIQPESARRVGHPAPFPVEVPRRCIELLTYRDDVVLDPFMGSGSTAVAAVRTDRRYVGYDTDPAYVALAEKRIAEAQELVDTPVDPSPAEAEGPEGDPEDHPS